MTAADSAAKPQGAKPRKRTFTVTVSLSTVISSVLVVCAGFVAMFALGVLLGRGYDPESGILELQRMMSQPGRPSAPMVISEGDPDGNAPAVQEHNGILSQGDLAYPDSLRTPQRTAPKPQDAPRQAARPEQPPKPEQPRQTQTQSPLSAQRTAPMGAPGLTPLPMTDTAPARTAAQGRGATSGDQTVYHYTYQTAAYKDEASSDRFTARLKNAGLNVHTRKSTDNGVTWYRVMVDFTGRPDDADALRAKLQNLGAGKPIMKSKVPAR